MIFLLPRFVATSPEVFVHSYLEKTMRYVLETLAKRDEFRPLCFISAGEIAKNMGGFVYKCAPCTICVCMSVLGVCLFEWYCIVCGMDCVRCLTFVSVACVCVTDVAAPGWVRT